MGMLLVGLLVSFLCEPVPAVAQAATRPVTSGWAPVQMEVRLFSAGSEIREDGATEFVLRIVNEEDRPVTLYQPGTEPQLRKHGSGRRYTDRQGLALVLAAWIEENAPEAPPRTPPPLGEPLTIGARETKLLLVTVPAGFWPTQERIGMRLEVQGHDGKVLAVSNRLELKRPPFEALRGPLTGTWLAEAIIDGEVGEVFTLSLAQSEDGRLRGWIFTRGGEDRLRRLQFDPASGNLSFDFAAPSGNTRSFEARVDGEEIVGTYSYRSGLQDIKFRARRESPELEAPETIRARISARSTSRTGR